MTRHWSQTTNGFHSEAVHGPRKVAIAFLGAPLMEVDNPGCRIPADAVEVTEEEHQALLAEQAKGGLIVAGTDGRPVVVDRPPASAEDQWRRLRRLASEAHQVSDRVVLRFYEDGQPLPPAWRAYRVALRAIEDAETGDASVGLPAIPD